MTWYHVFTVCLFFVWIGSSKSDRMAARIVFTATVVSQVVFYLFTSQIAGAWKLAIAGAVETVTVLCLLSWARTTSGLLNAFALVVAWLAHLFCFIDVTTGSAIVYDRYSELLALVACAQIAAFHDTFCLHFSGLSSRLADFAGSCGRALRLRGAGAAVLHRSRVGRL